jgi:hypothetical protein
MPVFVTWKDTVATAAAAVSVPENQIDTKQQSVSSDQHTRPCRHTWHTKIQKQAWINATPNSDPSVFIVWSVVDVASQLQPT